MPPYFSVHYSFPYSIFTPNFVGDMYNTVFRSFPFRSGYWISENHTLEEIVNWNTSLLEKKFKLGFDQHVKHDYRQILLYSELYSHLRLFFMYRSNEIELHLIIPENDILLDDEFLRYDSSKVLPLLDLSLKIWNSFGVNTIQTYHELGAPISYKKIMQGQPPSTAPFSILPEINNQFKNNLDDKFFVKELNQGMLLFEKDHFYVVGDSAWLER
ncbi:hypothetical protein B5M42_011325 [Paenibacillus athensensis]|uniref:Uncharacterized protein n=1 Tax=Paenibacillus athensensis TaxID=1967502 RepID=A0A4Y8PVK4_9BACL|nr:hypothetical protein [Paenibacillus athensensis]MCD1259425.1 hypothetical protein [Paenibacillus athensensis]